MNQEHTLKLLESEKAKKLLGELYGEAAIAENQKRYEDLVGKFVKEFGERSVFIQFSGTYRDQRQPHRP